MSKRKLSSTEMVAKTKHKVVPCSTPEHYSGDSPSHDSDSIYDSDTASPVPFLCTQDGAEGEVDVVWNYNTPKAEIAKTRYKNTTPVSRKGKKIRPKLIDKSLQKPQPIKPSLKRSELFQELFELNKNVHEYIKKKPSEKPQSEEDIFSDNSDSSPKSIVRPSSRCLRKNVLSSKFPKTETENGLESDDSMNECLLKASQVVEDNFFNFDPTVAKRPCLETPKAKKKDCSVNFAHDSMDAILNNIRLESPSVVKAKNCDSPKLNNDSFDNLLENLNDSALERLSQMPLKLKKTPLHATKGSEWKVKEVVVSEGSPSNNLFGRHNSMPESPSAANIDKPSTSGMGFGRYNSMPFNKSINKGDSPIKCTPDEIEKKRKQAREKLLAKRLLPFTQQPSEQQAFHPVVTRSQSGNTQEQKKDAIEKTETKTDLKSIIEKKRQEAIQRLRKRQNK